MYERLRVYKEANGTCNVPNRYPKDPQLGFWVSTQRRQYRVLTSGGSTSSALTVQRAQKLMNLGFEWSAKDPRMVPWETRYNQLKDFVAKHGHAQVPIGWEENVPLSNWVSKQRQEYKLLQKGKASRLTDERIQKLKAIGFVWEAKRGAPRQVITSGDRQSSASSHHSSPEQRHRPNVALSVQPRLGQPEPASTPPTAQRPLRGMGPVSPSNSASAPAPFPPGLPPARLPPQAQPSYHFGPDATFHGVFAPRQQEYYPSNHQPHAAQSYYPNTAYTPPPYPPSVASSASYRHHEGMSPSLPPPAPAPSSWPIPRTGRVLTPLYPMEPPTIPGYLVATPQGSPPRHGQPPPQERRLSSADSSRRPGMHQHQSDHHVGVDRRGMHQHHSDHHVGVDRRLIHQNHFDHHVGEVSRGETGEEEQQRARQGSASDHISAHHPPPHHHPHPHHDGRGGPYY